MNILDRKRSHFGRISYNERKKPEKDPDVFTVTAESEPNSPIRDSSRRCSPKFFRFGRTVIQIIQITGFMAIFGKFFEMIEAPQVEPSFFGSSTTLDYRGCRDAYSRTGRTDEDYAEEERCLNYAASQLSTIRSWADGVLLVWSLCTTIGYGNKPPKTTAGICLVIFVTLIGIACLLSVKVELGRFVTDLIYGTAAMIERLCSRGRKMLGKRKTAPKWIVGSVFLFHFTGVVAVASWVLGVFEHLSVLKAVYLTIVSIYLVGLGDYTPSESWSTFVVILPLFFYGDILSSFYIHYIKGKFEAQSHAIMYWLVTSLGWHNGKNGDHSKDDPPEDYPAITTTSMPFDRHSTMETIDESASIPSDSREDSLDPTSESTISTISVSPPIIII